MFSSLTRLRETLLLLSSLATLVTAASLPDLYEASIADLQVGLGAGDFSSVDLVKAYLARIEEVNLQGPGLRAVIETSPSVLEIAATLDKERGISGSRGFLHGIPVLLKDNIATIATEGLNTTAGSYSLLGSIVPDDAGVVKKLRKAGAIILANLSEWAHARGNTSNGWSGRGGQSTNAYYPKADPCGSSSGSAIASSIGLTTVSLGTETDGSLICPADHNNVVGFKPTLGLTSRAGVIPLSEHQDSVGPLTRSVTDAAIVLAAIAGKDPNDNFTLAQPSPVPDFMKALRNDSLVGKRLGVPREVFMNTSLTGVDPYVNDVLFEQALDTLRSLGATVVDPANVPSAQEVLNTNETTVCLTDFKIQINAWFASLISNPSGVRSLEDLIVYDNANASLEESAGNTDQSDFIIAQSTTGYNSTYYASLAADHEIGGACGIDATLKMYSLDALVLPATAFPTVLPALAGYPIVSVPMGFYPENVTIQSAGPETVYPAPGVPLGLTFFSTAWTDYDLLGYAYAYEQKTQTRLQRKAYPEAIPKTQLSDIIGGQ